VNEESTEAERPVEEETEVPAEDAETEAPAAEEAE
jgi:hypothetical protein